MSLAPFLIGAIVGAFVVNFFFDHWDAGDYFFGVFITGIIGCILATGAWWVVNNVELEAPAAAEAAVAVEQVSVEEEALPQEESPKPQFDFGLGDFE